MRTKIVRKTCAGKFEQLRTLNPGILLIVSSEVFEDVQKPCTPKAEATGSNPVGRASQLPQCVVFKQNLADL